MDRQMIWKVLGIEETRDENGIKQAYRNKLTLVNPEDDAEGFMKLRKAYEEALEFIKTEEGVRDEDEDTGKEKTEVEIWLEKVDKVYSDIRKRIDVNLWKELLRDEVCVGLDTSLEAGEKLLVFLMNHYYLPQPVWQVLDREFNFINEKEQLSEKFPSDFLDYVVNQVQTKNFLDYKLFEIRGEYDADSYIHNYYEIKGILDRNNISEEKDRLSELMEETDAASIYHPYAEVEKLRFYLETSPELTIDTAQRLAEKYPEDDYILYYAGKIKWMNEDFKEAYHIWEQVLKISPEHYSAKAGIARYLLRTGEYEKAKDAAMDLLEIYRNDQEMLSCMREANEHLITIYKARCEEDKNDLKTRIELGWCFYQNEKCGECEQALLEVPAEERSTYDYMYLSGRNYFSWEKYEKSLEYFLPCLVILKTVNEDSTEEEKGRLKRFGFIQYCIAQCYKETGQPENSIPYFKDAIEAQKNQGDRLFYMDQLSGAYLKLEKNEEAIDLSDRIIKEDKTFYPAYLHRQEGYFNLKNLQGVVDDFYSCHEIFPGFVKPYVLAAKAFYYTGQYEDSKNIVSMAREAGLSSNELELCYIRDLRYLAETRAHMEEAVLLALDLKKRLKQEDNDIEDISEVDFEIALLYMDGSEEDKALEFVNLAIRQNPSEFSYQRLKADIYLEKKEYQTALNYYLNLVKEAPDSAGIHYNMGRCHEALGKTSEALKEYKKTLELDPEHRTANNLIMDIYQRTYKNTEKHEYYKEALSYADRQLELMENCYNYVERGLLYLDGYELEKAIEDFQKGAQFNEEDIFTHNNAGYSYKILRELDKGIEELNKAISLSKPGESILPYGNLASCYEIAEQYEKALETLDAAIAVFPENTNMYERKGEIYTKMGQYKKALEAYRKLYDFPEKDKGEVCINLGNVYEAAGKNVMAFYYFKLAVSKSPKNADALHAYASFLCNSGHYRKAVSWFKKAVKYTDMDSDVNTNNYVEYCIDTAYAYWECKKFKKAGQWANKAVYQILQKYGAEEDYTDYPMNSPSHCVDLGYVYLFSQDLKLAEDYFIRSYTKKPCRNCEYYYCYEGYFGLGLVYEKMNLPEKALECYKKVLAVNWNFKKCKRKLEALEKSLGRK